MTLTCLAIVFLGPPHFDASFRQWLANLSSQRRVRPALHGYVLLVAGDRGDVLCLGRRTHRGRPIPRRIDTIILIWLGITFANELTLDAPLVEKLFLTDIAASSLWAC